VVNHLDVCKPIIIATKGIERVSLSLMSEVVADIFPNNPILILSGPNFAAEVAKGLPSATTLACTDKALANEMIYAIGGKYFRPYYTDDVVGAQIGGAVKNVIAIACGIATGCGFGENARSALITRGLSEMARLCVAKGGRSETLMGLSGFGDLVLTCGSPTSRNMSLGIEIGKQQLKVKEILAINHKKLAEGVATSESVTQLANQMGVHLPICRTVYEIVTQEKPIEKAINELLERQFSAENQG
jgi:glycerol-3-phosphate dehydrogenase (NAD(P)+)